MKAKLKLKEPAVFTVFSEWYENPNLSNTQRVSYKEGEVIDCIIEVNDAGLYDLRLSGGDAILEVPTVIFEEIED